MFYKRLKTGFRVLVLLAMTVLSFSVISNAQDSRLADEVLVHINRHRAQMGLSKLQMDDRISEIAEKHSRQMANGSVAFGHDGFNGRVKTISRKIDHIRGFAENVAFGDMGAKEVVKMWLGSSGHRKNIEGHYNLTGIGIAKARDGNLYFTQIFILNK